jgi:hypothetical protein
MGLRKAQLLALYQLASPRDRAAALTRALYFTTLPGRPRGSVFLALHLRKRQLEVIN